MCYSKQQKIFNFAQNTPKLTSLKTSQNDYAALYKISKDNKSQINNMRVAR